MYSKVYRTGGERDMKEKTKMITLQTIGKLVSIKVEYNSHLGPPMCRGILYQPKRPRKLCDNTKEDS